MIRTIQAITAVAALAITRGALTGHLGTAARLIVLVIAACIVTLIIGLELLERRPPTRRTR